MTHLKALRKVSVKKLCPIFSFFLAMVFFLFSCAVVPGAPASQHFLMEDIVIEASPIETPTEAFVEAPFIEAPIKASAYIETAMLPERPAVPQYIMGSGLVSAEGLAAFLLYINPEADSAFAESLAQYYVEEAALEGVNHDVAFAQMGLETGFLRFGNLVSAEQNNFAGLGATGPGFPGLRFSEPRIGVRAQIQHLVAYATDTPLNQELVNPRFFLVRRGSSPDIRGLAGTWAEDPLYADKINTILQRLYFFSFEN